MAITSGTAPRLFETCCHWSAIFAVWLARVWPATVLELLPVMTAKPVIWPELPERFQTCCSRRAAKARPSSSPITRSNQPPESSCSCAAKSVGGGDRLQGVGGGRDDRIRGRGQGGVLRGLVRDRGSGRHLRPRCVHP